MASDDAVAVQGLLTWLDESLATLASATSAAPSSRSAPVPKLSEMPVAVSWLPRGCGTVRGLVALRDIACNEVILTIPYRCLLTAERVITELCPRLASEIQEVEQIRERTGQPNPVTALLPNSNTILASCEHVLALYLIVARYVEGDAGAAGPYTKLLPPLLSVSTPEFFFLLEYDSCSPVYVDNDSEVARHRSSASKLLSLQEMVAHLGSRCRWNKLTRRIERLYLRYAALRHTYFVSADDAAVTPSDAAGGAGSGRSLRSVVGKELTFPRWLWATHMVNSRTFMYRRPRWSLYPRKYELDFANETDTRGGTEGRTSGASSSSADGSERSDVEEEDILNIVNSVREARRQVGAGLAGQESLQSATKTVLEQAALALEDDNERGTLRMTGASSSNAHGGGRRSRDDDTTSDDSSSSSSASSSAPAEADLLAMAPFADMLNHDPVQGTSDFTFDKTSSDLVIRADKPIFCGDEVFLKYNSMDHWRFAKYYGWVPDYAKPGDGSHGTTASPSAVSVGPNDAFPIQPPLPPSITAESENTVSVLAVTKAQLFEGRALKRHCYVTKRGPNQQLRSVLRLAFLGPEELPRYASAYDADPLTVRNEWHAFQYLVTELSLRKMEVERSARQHGSAAGLSPRGLVAVAVRERDARVLALALEECQKRFTDLSGLLYYGTATSAALRRTVIHKQFDKLVALGRLPTTAQEQRDLGLGLLPNLSRPAQFSVSDYVDVLMKRVATCRRDEEKKASLLPRRHADPEVGGPLHPQNLPQ